MTKLKSKLFSLFASIGLNLMNENSKITYMILNCRPTNISNIVILNVVKLLTKKFTSKLSNLKEHGITFKGKYNNKQVSVITMTVGAPASAMIMEALNRTKAEVIIKVDYCGGLLPEIKLGDIIIADSAICADGTTPHYDNENKIINADVELLNKITTFFDDNKIKYIKGPIFTTDAIFRETESLLNEARDKGAVAIDMESSVLYVLGKLFNKKVISINIVSDKPDPSKKFNLNLSSKMVEMTDFLPKKILDFISEIE
ncbi:MAG: nucleoside phosphorylase [Candidatus Helarchaeota archaeon]